MTLDVSATPRTPFHRLVRTELRKSYDTRSGFWLLAIIGLVVLAAEVIVLAVVTTQDEAISFGDFIGVAAFLTSFLLPVLGSWCSPASGASGPRWSRSPSSRGARWSSRRRRSWACC